MSGLAIDLPSELYKPVSVSNNVTAARGENWSRFGHSITPTASKSSKPRWPSRNYRDEPRVKRSSIMNTCDLMVMMDTFTFQKVGRSSPHRSAGLLLYWYQLADRVFATTDFKSLDKARLLVRSIVILKEYTPLSERRRAFNHDPASGIAPEAIDTLMALAEEVSFREYCLGHLTTQRQMAQETLGLAFLGNNPTTSTPYWRAGLCAANSTKAANVGFSVYVSSVHLDPMYVIELTHEIAHGFGAGHDPPTGECAPSETKGGKYLMFFHVGTGHSANNMVFSKCSINDMDEIFKYKAHKCLIPNRVEMHSCGDGRYDDSEECDEGQDKMMPCCTHNCRLRSNATCSPSSSPCCTDDCRVAPPTQTCLGDLSKPCYKVSHCDGVESRTCPKAHSLPNGAPCGDFGTCWFGECLNYCANKSRMSNPPGRLELCHCDSNRRAGCSICCQDVATQKCKVLPVFNPDNTVCPYGTCYGGICKKNSDDSYLTMVQKLHRIRALEKFPFVSNLVVFTIAVITPIYTTAAVYIFWRVERSKIERDGKEQATFEAINDEDEIPAFRRALALDGREFQFLEKKISGQYYMVGDSGTEVDREL